MRRTRETQVDAYNDLKPTLSAKLGMVFRAIETQGPMASFQLASFLGWPINCISGKVTVLCDQSRLKDSGKRVINPRSGKNCILWEPNNAKEEDPQYSLYPEPGQGQPDAHHSDLQSCSQEGVSNQPNPTSPPPAEGCQG